MRLVTRSDFDGLCCAVLLKELGIIDSMIYAHPKDLQDGRFQVGAGDVLANVPYVAGCGLWFDHHTSETERAAVNGPFKGLTKFAPSAARVIYDYYDQPRQLDRFQEMLTAVDKVDSAQLSYEDIVDPSDWVLLGFICDPRTGLGYHRQYRISNMELMLKLVDMMRAQSIADILADPDVRERVERYREMNSRFLEFMSARSRQDGPIIVTDTRGIPDPPPGNRFLIYTIYPQANISIRIIDVKGGQAVSFSVGHSVINRTSRVDVGSLMLKYGGGGHRVVGTCQVPRDRADQVLAELMGAI